MNALIFNDITLTPVQQPDNQIWLTSTDLAKALGYSKSNAVAQIYNRHSDEFTEQMTTSLKLSVVRKTGSVEMDTRIFSLRGCHLVAMLAKTKVAKEFRKWVLNILDQHIAENNDPDRLSTVAERRELNIAIRRLALLAGVDYQFIYQRIWKEFNVENASQLPARKIPEILRYVYDLIAKFTAHEQPKQQPSDKMPQSFFGLPDGDFLLRVRGDEIIFRRLDNIQMLSKSGYEMLKKNLQALEECFDFAEDIDFDNK